MKKEYKFKWEPKTPFMSFILTSLIGFGCLTFMLFIICLMGLGIAGIYKLFTLMF